MMGNYTNTIIMVLRIIFVVVFAGWLMIWILLPTKTYQKKWYPKHLDTNLNSTYFREQGTNLLLFTFPIMFIATLSCIFLHLQQKRMKKEELQPRRGSISTGGLGMLRRPVMVGSSSIGVLTAMEVTFAAMFCALLIWSLSNYLHTSFAHLHMHKKGEKVWEAKFRSVSLRLGYIGNICWAFLFFPVTRGSSLLPLVGLTSESSIKYHIWFGHLSNFLFLAHTIGFIIYWAITQQMVEILEWSKTYVSNVAGVIATIVAVVMWVTSISRIRRKMFEVFFYTHQLYILYIVFYAIHVGVKYMCMIAPGIFLFLLDRHLRFLQSRKSAMLLSARLLPCATLELNFSKTPDLHYNPTSMVFINVASISKLQWHPFTVTSSSKMESDKLSVAIKTLGSWSRNLYDTLLSSNNLDRLQVSLEGPYGPSSSHFLRHEQLVLVSGGSGITPFISIIRDLIFRQPNQNDVVDIPRILLICAFKSSSDLTLLDLILPLTPSPSSTAQMSPLQLQIQAYVTREAHEPPPQAQAHTTRTLWFKPNPTLDSPISPVLGPNNWLWLAAIMCSSFLMFLLLLGLVTRYYIYPFEKENEKGEASGVYHWTYKVLWFLFLQCAAIWVSCSVAFVWCKRQSGLESKQILNVEGPTSDGSPGLERELEIESVPHHSLLQATKVFYGSRPHLKKILSECKGDDVGVLVCGPKKMRHEVASLCSSHSGNNLHFEAISFNW